jgi:hypothetical protein
VRRWFREPLLHSLLAGALIFAIYDLLNPAANRIDRADHIGPQGGGCARRAPTCLFKFLTCSSRFQLSPSAPTQLRAILPS